MGGGCLTRTRLPARPCPPWTKELPMNSAVDEKIKVAYSGHPLELEVIGVWQDDMIVSAKVKHGGEYISPILYDLLFMDAVHRAELMHRAYLEDQQERKAAIISGLMGY